MLINTSHECIIPALHLTITIFKSNMEVFCQCFANAIYCLLMVMILIESKLIREKQQ